MLQYSAENLHLVITSSNYDTDYKCRVITELKAHIKRDFVELTQVPRYFESLKVANKSNDYKLSSLAFSSICHLVKRVGMQDPNALRGCSKVVLPVLINRLLDTKSNFQSQAKSSLETFWLATPSIVENYIKDNALIHSNSKIRSESIVFMSDLIELNKNFNFFAFLPNLVNLMRDDSTEVTKNVEVLLLKYYTLHKIKVNELVKELKGQRIEQKKAVKLLRDIDLVAANSYSTDPKPVASKPTIDTFNNLSRTRKVIPSSSTQSSRSLGSQSASKEISDILSLIPTAKLDDSISPLYITSATDFAKELETLLPPFSGKETEFNWNNREKSIIKFRGYIIANSDQYPEELIQATRSMNEGIFKSVSSLRTTLSSNGCQLVKELAAHLTKHLDPIIETLFQPLASLTSATKKIASLNAFGSLSVLLANTSFNNRLFNQCFALFQDKNVQPRLYSSTFLQIFILRHGSKLDSSNQDTIKKWVAKGVCDPNTNVRESMRVTFWLLVKKFPEIGNEIYAKFDTSVKKALDRSKPQDIDALAGSSTSSLKPSSITADRKRQTIRELAAAKQRDRRSTSGPPQLMTTAAPINENTDTNETSVSSLDLGRPGRIGMPQRVGATASRVLSSGSAQPLQRQLSKGSMERQRWPSVGSITRDNIDTSVKNEVLETSEFDEIDNLKRLLKSPYTRERVEAIKELKKLLEQDVKIDDISSLLNNLVILDAGLFKPVLNIPRFFHLVDTLLAVKVLAVNKENIDIIVQEFGIETVIKALVSLIDSLESLQFDGVPSTMFHIKFKNLLLNFAVQNIYSLTSDESFRVDINLLRAICAATFPLSVSDYPKYDELIVQLYTLNTEIFQDTLSKSSAYVSSKVTSIIDEFKDDIAERPLNDFTESRLGEMTMINPLNRKATDPTLSLTQGFSTDMTRVIPKFEAPTHKNHDEDSIMEDQVLAKKVDYMGGIFSKDSTPDVEMNHVEAADIPRERAALDSDIDLEVAEFGSQRLELHEHLEAAVDIRADSPFLDHPEDDDLIHIRDPNIPTDEATKNLTNQINEIHISPEKAFRSPDRRSLTQMITETDPIFNQAKVQIKIYEDLPSDSLERKPSNSQRKLFDFELARFQYLKEVSEVSIESLKELAGKFVDDKISTPEMDSMIKSLHQVINSEDVVLWIKESGFGLLMDSLITYFNSSINITKQLCFKGLVVFKELLIINDYLDGVMTLQNSLGIWNILIMIVENLKNFKNDIYISVDELVEDLLELEVPGNLTHILESCCATLKDSNSLLLTSFLLLTLTRCIEKEHLSLNQIKEIDDIVYKFLSHDEVEIRRLTIITYSNCKRKLQKFKSHSRNGSMIEVNQDNNDQDNIQDIYRDVFDKLSVPERKLVDYYCDY